MTDAPDSFVSISSGALSAQINPFGAELSVLKDARGNDLLWDGDPAFWTGRAPILFPIVGALADNRYSLAEQTFDLPKHGFARRSHFTVVEAKASRAVFRLSSSDETLRVYPFKFDLDIEFALDGATLSMNAHVRNLGDADMPASFGFHPAFRWPLSAAQPRDQHFLLFDQDEPAPIRRLDKDGLIAPERFDAPVEGRQLRLNDDLFRDDAIILDQIKSRSLIYGAERGPRLRIEFPDMPYLGIWMKPGASYVCIEPWQGIADPQGFDGDFCDKPGVFVVPPQGVHSCAMQVTLQNE